MSRWDLFPSNALGVIESPTVRELKIKNHQTLRHFGHRLRALALAENRNSIQARIPSCPPLHGIQQCSASPRSKALSIQSVDIWDTDTAGTIMGNGSDINYQVDFQANKVTSGRWNRWGKRKNRHISMPTAIDGHVICGLFTAIHVRHPHELVQESEEYFE